MKTRILENKALFFILAFWVVFEGFAFGNNKFENKPEAIIPDTLELYLEPRKNIVSDTLAIDIFTGQSTARTVKLINKDISSIICDISPDFHNQETFVLKFDGGDDIVDFGVGILHKYKSWTLEAWIYSSGDKYLQTIYDEAKEILGSQGVHIRLIEGRLTLSFDNYGSTERNVSTGPDLRDSAWHHVTAVKKEDSVFLFVDGSLKIKEFASNEIDSGLIARISDTCPEHWTFGEDLIYNLRIWDYALSENEINNLRFTDLVGNEKGLISYWKFINGSGNTIYDRSEKNRNGILNNDPEWVKKPSPYTLNWINVIPGITNINGNTSNYISIKFDATGLNNSTYLGTINFISESSNDTALRLPVNIYVKNAPDILLFHDTIIYDEVIFRIPESRDLHIRNRGIDTLVINEITANNLNFYLDRTNLKIPPGAGDIIRVTYNPAIFGKQRAMINISSNDPDQQITILNLSVNKLIIPRTIIYRWFAIASIILITLILLFIYLRLRLKHKLNRQLEHRINEAIKVQEQQQNIILHQSSLTMLGEISAGIAREIKIPLENIQVATRNIEIDRDENIFNIDHIKNMVAGFYGEVDKINKLIDHVRIFASQQKSKLTEKFSINEVISDALSMVRLKLENQKINIELDLSDDLPVMTGNPYKLEQVILNLVNNAMDAMNIKNIPGIKNGSNTIRIVTSVTEEYVEIRIIDTGVGIDEKRKVQIFEPFYSTKEPGVAAGLGLSISESLMSEMNGNIDIDSKSGSGVTCILTIPIDA